MLPLYGRRSHKETPSSRPDLSDRFAISLPAITWAKRPWQVAISDHPGRFLSFATGFALLLEQFDFYLPELNRMAFRL
jgi:hypothetical protein